MMFKKSILLILLLFVCVPGFCTKPVWVGKLASEMAGSPLIHKNVIYISTKRGFLYSFDYSGNLIWKKRFNSPAFAPASVNSDGDIFQPLVKGYIAVIRPDGNIKCRLPVSGELRSGVIAHGNRVFIADDDGRVYCFDTRNMKRLWVTKTGFPVFSTGVQDSKRRRLIIPSKNSVVHCLDNKGKILWKFHTAGVILSSPALTREGDIYLTSMDHHLYKISSEGKLIWKFKAERWVVSSPVVGRDGKVYFGSYDSNFYCLDPSGKLMWKHRGKSSFNSSPVIDEFDNVYVGDSSGMVYGFSSMGNLFFSYKYDDFIRSEFTIAPDKNLLIAGSVDATVFGLRCRGTLSKKAVWSKSHGDSDNTGSK